MSKTIAEEISEEQRRFNRRFVHHVLRPRAPMSLDEALKFSRLMAAEDEPYAKRRT